MPYAMGSWNFVRTCAEQKVMTDLHRRRLIADAIYQTGSALVYGSRKISVQQHRIEEKV